MAALQFNVKNLNANEDKKEFDQRDIKPATVRLYKRRYLYLLIFSVGSLLSDITYSQYSIASDFLATYYGVSVMDVQWTSLVYSLGYIIPVYPTLVLIERKGLKISFVFGLFTVAAGMWIQGIGTYYDAFWAIMLGQCVISCVQCCFVNITPQFVSYWYPIQDISTSCAVGIFFNIAGMSLSCILTPNLIYSMFHYTVAQKLTILNFVLATLTTLLTVISFLVLEERPPLPPSEAQAQIWTNNNERVSIWSMLRTDLENLLRNSNFVVHLWSAGLILSFVAFAGIILNQLLVVKYPDNANDIGAIGLVMYFMGIPGTVVIGRVLNKTHKFKEIIVGNNVVIVLSLCFFVGSIYINITSVYVASAIFGFFLIGYCNVALEFASEITYPVNEVTSASLVMFLGNIVGIAMTYLTNWLLSNYNMLVSSIVLIIFSVIPAVLSVFVKADLRRIHTEEKQNSVR